MQLFVLRHGDAEMRPGPDPDRNLTELGRHQVGQIVMAQQAALAGVTTLVVSPYVRAQQTAAIVGGQLGLSVVTDCRLTPDSGINAMASLLESYQGEVPLLVSHQPLVGNFIDWLAGLERGACFMGTSHLAALKTDVVARGCGELLWLVGPEHD